jgi:hypothetical protein
LKAFFPVEHFDTGSCAQTAHMLVNSAIAEPLVNGAVAHVADKLREKLRAKFPITKMAQEENDGPALAEMLMNDIDILDLHPLLDLIDRHGSELDAAENIGAELLEMLADEMAKLIRGRLRGEGDAKIAQGKPAIVGQDKPRPKTGELAQPKKERERQRR